MDVQRPPQQPEVPSRPQPNIVQPSSNPSLSRPATREYTRPRPDGSTPDFSGPNTHVPPAAPSQKEPKSSKGKKIAIGSLVAIIILLLAGTGAYLYLNMQDEPAAPVATETTPEPAPEEGVQATPAGLDKVIADIDQILNSLDDTADFKPNDLSDDSLGL